MRTNTLREQWLKGESTFGLWISETTMVGAEQLGGVGFDYCCVDMQHGLSDYSDALRTFISLAGSASTPIARVPWNEPGIIGRVLDAGAMGVIVPMVNTAAQAQAATAACRYVPDGLRSYGPIRAGFSLGPNYAAEANDNVVVIPMIETVEALNNLDAILDTPGIDAVYVGPTDLSLSLGLPPTLDQDDASFDDALKRVIVGCEKRGITPGIHASPTLAAKRLEQGFRMVTVTSDLGAMLTGATTALAQANK